MPEPSQLDRMRDIYARVPRIECKRRCQQACGPVFEAGGLTVRERDRVFAIAGTNTLAPGLQCGYLDESGRCGVYSLRPLVCRLWGTVDDPRMRCPHGCEPERWLTTDESYALLREMEEVAGGPVPGDPTIGTIVNVLSGHWRWKDEDDRPAPRPR